MPITKDQRYAVYEMGIKDGKRLISKSAYSGDDLLEMATSAMSPKTAKQVKRSPLDELIHLVSDYMDGVEDGVKAQVQREKQTYIKWMQEDEQ